MRIITFTLSILCLSFILNTDKVSAQEAYTAETSEETTILDDRQINTIILQGTLDDVKKLIDEGYNIKNEYGCGALNTAIQSLYANQMISSEDTIEKIKLIIDAGADTDKELCDMTPITMAVSIPVQLNEYGNRIINMVNAGLETSEENCEVNGVTKPCKELTPEDKNSMDAEILKMISEERERLEPYIIQIIDILLASGADINKGQMPPVYYASTIPSEESVNILEHLLNKGANPNIKTADRDTTPLFGASFFGNQKAIDLLIAAGADTSIRNKGGLLYDDEIIKNKYKTINLE